MAAIAIRCTLRGEVRCSCSYYYANSTSESIITLVRGARRLTVHASLLNKQCRHDTFSLISSVPPSSTAGASLGRESPGPLYCTAAVASTVSAVAVAVAAAALALAVAAVAALLLLLLPELFTTLMATSGCSSCSNGYN
jgi:hypothetical protein